MKVLSIDQMSRLKELGVDVKPKGLGMIHQFDGGNSYRLIYGESTCEDDMGAFDLQDIIELLPAEIEMMGRTFYLSLGKISDTEHYILYESEDIHVPSYFKKMTMLDAAYNMLIWVITMKYLETK